jgi:hypothetical protein
MLFDAFEGGTQIGVTNTVSSAAVSNGLFTAPMDFGAAAFIGTPRFLQIAVRCPAGSGDYVTLSPRQTLTSAPAALFAPITVRDAAGNVRVNATALESGEGLLNTFGPNGRTNTLLSSLVDSPNNGFIGAYADGTERAGLAAGDAGFVRTWGPNGKLNTLMTFLGGKPNNGYVGVYDETGAVQAAMFVNADGEGEIFADKKNFVVDHPRQPGAKIVYTSLEGPEAAIYHRGVVALIKGRATIELPEHFTALAKPDTITVQLTPASFDSQGLGVGEIRDGRIDIGELHKGNGSYEVHFVVHALRRGHEDRAPVISAAEFQGRFAHAARGDTPVVRESAVANGGFEVSAVAPAGRAAAE